MFGFRQKSKDKKLVRAVQHMRPDVFLQALQEGANVQQSAPWIAGLFEHNADAASVMVEWALPFGLDVQAPLYDATPSEIEEMDLGDADDYPLQTLFNTVAAFNVKWLVDTMLEKGADVCHRDSFGRTPFFEAVNNNSFETARALADQGGLYVLPQYTFCIALAVANPAVPADLMTRIVTHPDIFMHFAAGGRDGSLSNSGLLLEFIAHRDDGDDIIQMLRNNNAVPAQDWQRFTQTATGARYAPPADTSSKIRKLKIVEPQKTVDTGNFRKLTDYSVESVDGGGLTTVFNFKTGYFVVRENGRALGAPQSFDDIKRKETIEEAYDALVALKGHPPAFDRKQSR